MSEPLCSELPEAEPGPAGSEVDRAARLQTREASLPLFVKNNRAAHPAAGLHRAVRAAARPVPALPERAVREAGGKSGAWRQTRLTVRRARSTGSGKGELQAAQE